MISTDTQPGTRVRRIADGALGSVLAVDPEDGVTVHMDHGSHTLGSFRAWELIGVTPRPSAWRHLDGESCKSGPERAYDALCSEHGRLVVPR